jgi:hypothetical protein
VRDEVTLHGQIKELKNKLRERDKEKSGRTTVANVMNSRTIFQKQTATGKTWKLRYMAKLRN